VTIQPEASGRFDHLGPDDGVDAPGQCLNERPAAGTAAVEPELATEPIEAVEDVCATVAELRAADDRRESELALAEQGLRVDREPWFAGGAQHVSGVHVLVQEHLLALTRGELAGRLQRGGEELALERSAPRAPTSRGASPPSARPRPRAR
jgi:hypothetical protein